ncbi:MAG: helix-turn-helix domain-containing protein [Ruminococcaceae bacterium]|nr:helix-turn-helix domain-containing protein [Oscillospiraceae bacterium]
MFVSQMDNAIYAISHSVVEKPKQEEYYLHSHNYCEILLFLSGDASFFIDREQYRLKPYDLILLPRRIPHYLLLKSATRYENYVIQFYDSLLYLKHRETLFQPPRIFNIENEPEVLSLFNKLDELYELYDTEDFHCIAQCICQEIVTRLCYIERVPIFNEGTGHLMILNVLQYINTHLEEHLDADLLAKQFNVSRSHLQNIFSKEIKTGLKQYIIERKILAAHDEMTRGLSAGDAAVKYGFREYSTFYRQFKKTFGKPPSVLKEKNTE